MDTRINYNNGYLFCNVDSEVINYQDAFNSSEECFAAVKHEIIEDCAAREYNAAETEAVLSHYEIKFNNANVEWNAEG